jgi:hypothetical protein
MFGGAPLFWQRLAACVPYAEHLLRSMLHQSLLFSGIITLGKPPKASEQDGDYVMPIRRRADGSCVSMLVCSCVQVWCLGRCSTFRWPSIPGFALESEKNMRIERKRNDVKPPLRREGELNCRKNARPLAIPLLSIPHNSQLHRPPILQNIASCTTVSYLQIPPEYRRTSDRVFPARWGGLYRLAIPPPPLAWPARHTFLSSHFPASPTDSLALNTRYTPTSTSPTYQNQLQQWASKISSVARAVLLREMMCWLCFPRPRSSNSRFPPS